MECSTYRVRFHDGREVPVRNIYCVGRNYVDHARELGNPVPDSPIFFQKALTSLSTGPEIHLPPNRDIHYELEVVALMGHDGFQIERTEAWNYVAGLALGLDLTDRSLQTWLKERRYPWFLAKSFPGAAYVTAFELPDRERWSQTFWLKIDGRLVQEGRLAEMIFDIPTLIHRLSSKVPLLKGDLLYTGTPAGVGLLSSGMHLMLGLGSMCLKKITVV
jgi:acylpyruvate hydrolase